MFQTLFSALDDRRQRRAAARISPEWAAARAREGAAYLDGADPGWAARIDPGSLVLADGQACVLGQLHGDYRRGLSRSRVLDLSSAPTRFVSPVDLGFQASGEGGGEAERLDYAFLTRAWREEVLRRRSEPLAQEAVIGRATNAGIVASLVLMIAVGSGCTSNSGTTVPQPEAAPAATPTPEAPVERMSVPTRTGDAVSSDSLAALRQCREGLDALASATTPEAEADAMDAVWALHYGLATDGAPGFDVWSLGFSAFDADGDATPAGDADNTASIDLRACGATTRHTMIDTENLYLLMRE